MSTTTALQLTQQAMGEMGLAVPTALFSSTNADLIQIRTLLNACGYELQRKHEWQALSSIYRFTTTFYTYTGDVSNGSLTVSNMSSTTGLTTNPTYFQAVGVGLQQDTFLTAAGGGTVTLSLAATGTQTASSLTFSQVMYPFPTDFDRLIDRTNWDKSQHWEMLGPETAQQWEWLKSGFISTGPRIRFRPLGNLFQIWPAIGSAHVLGFEYVSKGWAASSVAAVQNSFTADTDTCIFNDRLMVLFLKMKYFEIKGFDTTALMRDFVAELDLAKAHDAGNPTLSMNPRINSILIGWENIPDSSYGS